MIEEEKLHSNDHNHDLLFIFFFCYKIIVLQPPYDYDLFLKHFKNIFKTSQVHLPNTNNNYNSHQKYVLTLITVIHQSENNVKFFKSIKNTEH